MIELVTTLINNNLVTIQAVTLIVALVGKGAFAYYWISKIRKDI